MLERFLNDALVDPEMIDGQIVVFGQFLHYLGHGEDRVLLGNVFDELCDTLVRWRRILCHPELILGDPWMRFYELNAHLYLILEIMHDALPVVLQPMIMLVKLLLGLWIDSRIGRP